MYSWAERQRPWAESGQHAAGPGYPRSGCTACFPGASGRLAGIGARSWAGRSTVAPGGAGVRKTAALAVSLVMLLAGQEELQGRQGCNLGGNILGERMHGS